jgi:membrane fusion protein (multidrug efflux system)
MAFLQQARVRLLIGVVLILILGAGVWAWATAGRETTDDAQADARVTQISSRVSGTVSKVAVGDNQFVEPDTVLIELDRRDFQVAVDKARAELADAEAAAIAAQSSVPITSTTAASQMTTARGGVAEAASAISATEK